MAVRIVEPVSTNPQTGDWQNLLNKLTKTTGSFFLVQFTNIDNNDEPQIAQGSRFEINGSFFEVPEDEEITGWENIIVSHPAYIYAVPNTPDAGSVSTCTFIYSENAPVMDVAKGGLFDGVNRCLGWVRKESGTAFKDKTVAWPYHLIAPDPYNMVRVNSNNQIFFGLPVLEIDPVSPPTGFMWVRI